MADQVTGRRSSWATQQQAVLMPGTRSNSGKLRNCPKCSFDVDEAGGVELRPGVWRCAACWKARSLSKGKP